MCIILFGLRQTDWDLRLACLLLYAFDCKDNFWQLYGDFLPAADECTSLLLATEVGYVTLKPSSTYFAILFGFCCCNQFHISWIWSPKVYHIYYELVLPCEMVPKLSLWELMVPLLSSWQLQEDLLELQDNELASTVRQQQQRALDFWEKNWVWICLL